MLASAWLTRDRASKTTLMDVDANQREPYKDVRGQIAAVREFNQLGGQDAQNGIPIT